MIFGLRFLLAFILVATWTAAQAAEVSLTFDDFDVTDSVMFDAQERNRQMLKVLDEHSKLKTTLFVLGKNVQSQRGQSLLEEWDQQGHEIGNHTYSHLNYNAPQVSLNQFTREILKTEALIEKSPNFVKRFRFPFLHEGNTPEKISQLRAFLKQHGFMTGHVTIDASDWYISDRMKARYLKDLKADLTPYRDYYLEHIWNRAQFYNELSKKVLGREVKHTLLLHYNLLNALYLKDLIAMFESKGWKFISSSEAFTDPVFHLEGQMLPTKAPLANSILWQLARETVKYDTPLRDPGEDGEYERSALDRLEAKFGD